MNNDGGLDSMGFLGSYCSSLEQPKIPDHVSFFGGVFLTTVIPVTAYCINGGPVSPMLFGFVALAGIVAGLMNYKKSRLRQFSSAGANLIPRVRRVGKIRHTQNVPIN